MKIKYIISKKIIDKLIKKILIFQNNKFNESDWKSKNLEELILIE